MDYQSFIMSKSQVGTACGFEPNWMPEFLFGFQSHLCEWSIRKGRSAIFANCGLGKTPMFLVYAENVVRHTNRPVLVLTPLAVAPQFVSEGDKFGVKVTRSHRGEVGGAGVYVTNYDRLHLLNPSDFAAVLCDESACLKDFDAKTTSAVTEFMRETPFRLLGSATPAPNDYVELGTSSEALGEMGCQDMINRFFKQTTSKDHLGWGRTKYKMRGHAETDFWRWVCSWARAVRMPSDLGFDDGEFVLPPLETHEHCIEAKQKRLGVLFDIPAITLEEQREERRRTLKERCEKVAELVSHNRPAVCWGQLNDECDYLEKIIPDAVQVAGSDSEELKEERLAAFATGQIRVLITKPELAGYGLNWQHCAHQTFFPSHSFERYYQAVRRCWRFGQKNRVRVDMVTSEGEIGVLGNLNRKAEAAEVMFSRLVELMGDQFKIDQSNPFTKQERLPKWLSSTSA